MKQKLISLSFLLIFLSFCVLVVDTFVGKIEVQFSEKPLISSAFLALSALHTKEIFPSFYLVAGGDIMFSRNIGYYNKKRGYDRIFGSGQFNPVSKFSSCIAGNCLLFFNLESLFHPKDNDIQMGGFTFRANTANIEILKDLRKPSLEQANELGQNLALLLSLANNHTVNVGYEGIIATQDTLHVGGDIDSIGAGTTSEQAHRFFIMEPSEGFTICAQAYSYEGRENIKV
jgi:poly-gamma-glutamate capsule biosynthesis protein CapA/YwtB (metallophosphatase superfamily)